MKKILLRPFSLFSFLFSLSFFSCQSGESQKFNLGFETQKDKNSLSDGWFSEGNYEISIDQLNYSGKKSGKITADQEGFFYGAIVYKIPANYEGSIIRLDGFMKINNAENGSAGLFLRIDGNEKLLIKESSQKIIGTKDWQKYSIIAKYPEAAENIFIGGILGGKGEAWFDDFVLTIDGKNVQSLKEIEKKLPKAKLDKEFDNTSSVEITKLSIQTINNLVLLGKVWGFLKYHHPSIAKGNYNWDYELFRFLPRYLQLNGDKERDKFIIDWIDSLGGIGKCNKCTQIDENAFLKPDLKWIEHQKEPLKKKLLSIYKRRHQGKHYYVAITPVGNPEFLNEYGYPDISYPDDGFRLLSLYRYWNMIQYYFPYKYLIDKNWNLILKEYIPKFLNAKNELEYELAALQLIGDIQDTHANLWGGADKIDKWKGSNLPPIHVRFIEDQLVVTDFYNPKLKEQTELEIGDVITRINGQLIKELIEEKSSYYPASNVPTRLRNIATDILRSNSNEVEITFFRENLNKEFSEKLALISQNSLNSYYSYRKKDDKCYKIIDNNIGYITLESIKNEDIPSIWENFKETKGIIIDIRNYPSIDIINKLGSYFISSSVPFAKFTKGNVNNPGEFIFTQESEVIGYGKAYKGKLIIIVNELTQSHAEYTAMAFRVGDNTTIIGSTTAGSNGNVSTIFLPGGLRTSISGIGIYYPDGEETQRVGIVPDIEVKPTIKGIKKGRDELLEKAMDLILNK